MDRAAVELAEQELWSGYRRGDEAAREYLLQRYMPLARRLAASLYAARTGNGVEFGDYLQLAYVGLLEAMQRYRHDSAAQFATFAAYRIKGSILNGLPKMTERGDYISYLRRAQRERTESLMTNTERSPVDFSSMFDLVVGIALTYQLDELAFEQETAQTEQAHDPYASRAYEDVQKSLRAALAQLPNRERQILYYHYFGQMSFDDIAGVLALTKGRISQLHKRALGTLREVLHARRMTGIY